MVQISRRRRSGDNCVGSHQHSSFQLADAIAYYISLFLVVCVVGLVVLYYYLDVKGQLLDRQDKDLNRVSSTVKTLRSSTGDAIIQKEKEFLSKKEISNNMNPTREDSSDITHDKVHLVYGTAWKKDETSHLVTSAIRHGFRFIDTACQPKHYNEPGVGEGWTKAAAELNLKRSDIYLQTKYTSIHGQDPNRIPYNKNLSIADQVKESLQVSLTNLRTTYLDALVMHSPFPQMKDTLEAYKTMEAFVDEGKVKILGISNIYDFAKLKHIYEHVRIKPSIIQNRFYSDSGFDVDIRAFCQNHGMVYQSFWTLTANRHALATSEIRQLAASKLLTPQTLMYAYMMLLGGAPPTHTPLDGTTNEEHMKEDIGVQNRIRNGEKILTEEEMALMSSILGVSTASEYQY